MSQNAWNSLTAAKSNNGSIKRWVDNDSIDPEEIIAETESWLKDRLRVRFMRERVPLSLLAGASSFDLATVAPRFLEPVNLWVDGYGEVKNVPEDEINMRRWADSDGTIPEGLPQFYVIINQTGYFDTRADQDYPSLWLLYYAEPEAVTSENPTNLYTEKYRSLFKKVAMGHAYIFLKDEKRAGDLLSAAEADIKKIERTDELISNSQVYGYEDA